MFPSNPPLNVCWFLQNISFGQWDPVPACFTLLLPLHLRLNLFPQEFGLAGQALHLAFIGDNQGAFTLWAFGGNRPFPGTEFAFRVIGTAEKGAAFAGLALNNIAAVFRAGYANLLEERLSMAAVRGNRCS